MTLVAFTLPDDPTALPAWLERRLLAPDLGRFVSELSAAHPDDGTQSAEKLLGDWYPHVLEDGFAQVPVKRLRKLLRRPSCLLDLQEAILIEGSPHWDAVADAEEGFADAQERGKFALEKLLVKPRVVERRPTPPKRGRTYKTWAMAATALAACLLVTVGVLVWPSEETPRGKFEPVAWGWGRPGGLAADATDRAAYLKGLAKSADEWFEQRPTAAAAVGQRIAELRAGCSKLILSNYGPLPPDEKAWLIEKCKEWSRAMDAHLAAAEAGGDPVAVRGDVDATVRGISQTLRARAAG